MQDDIISVVKICL